MAMLEPAPLKAYDLLAELGRVFGPGYQPSPGGLYPAVTALVDEKLVRAVQEGRAKRYSLTAEGRRVLEQRRPQLASIENRTGARLDGATTLRAALERFVDRVMQYAGEVDVDAAEAVLDAAAHKLMRRTG